MINMAYRSAGHLLWSIPECTFRKFNVLTANYLRAKLSSTRSEKFNKSGIRGDGVMTHSCGLRVLSTRTMLDWLGWISEKPRRLLSVYGEAAPEVQLEPPTYTQFAKVDSGFLSWNFPLFDSAGKEIAFVSRAFRGFGREVGDLFFPPSKWTYKCLAAFDWYR